MGAIIINCEADSGRGDRSKVDRVSHANPIPRSRAGIVKIRIRRETGANPKACSKESFLVEVPIINADTARATKEISRLGHGV